MALADLAHHEGRDDSRRDAQARLGKAEAHVVGGDGDVADRDKARAAAQSGAVNAADDGVPAVVYGAEHVGHAQRVVDVVVVAEVQTGAHPVEVGSGAEARAVAAQHHRAHAVVRVQQREDIAQLGDEPLVEGVVDLGASEHDIGSNTAPHEPQVLIVSAAAHAAIWIGH